MKSCFISAPVNIDLGNLKSVLKAQGIHAVLPFELEITGANFREQIEKAIRKSDLFIALLANDSSNSNVFFELGYAWAKKKRVLLIQSRDLILPPNLSDFPILKCDINDKEKLSFFLKQFLEQDRLRPARSHEIEKTKPLSKRADELFSHLRALGKHASHKEFENIVCDVFRESGIRVFAESPTRDRGYDLALWLDELEYLIGNPLLVELKTHISRTTAATIKRSFLSNLNTSVGQALIVVFLESKESDVEAESSGAPLVLFVSASRLLSELENKSLARFILTERNRLAHGV